MTSRLNRDASQTESLIRLNEKMLELGQELLIAEMAQDTLYSCGYEFGGRTVGRYGWYETVNGELMAFQPKSALMFTLSYHELVVTGNLSTIQTMIQRLDDYQLAITEL